MKNSKATCVCSAPFDKHPELTNVFNNSLSQGFNQMKAFSADNFDAFVKQVKTHYPGMVSIEVYENLKNEVENACKKKQIAQQRMA